ncbi:molybdopterin-dependent oxidoreductase [uncultured Schumannella sp.]|uniref:molybdopterin-dependent oxidoreductase n=1 Tax=uncultured Schumannella sp. TaxID=1195956 RepID=UPI0025D2BA4D|nr:molybdopterin-dependent oxidoreductase [uncultured Schumannella sp.]
MRSSGTSSPARQFALPAVAGLAAGVAAAGAGELAAALLVPTGSPFTVIGAAAIDLAPSWAKDAAIALFGTADKIALIVGIGLVVAALAALAGVIESRRSPLGRVLFGVGAALGVAAAMTRSDAGLLSPLPSAVAGVVGAIALTMLLRKRPERPGEHAVSAAADTAGLSRRGFLGWSAGTAVVGALATLGANALQAATRTATTVREAFTLPSAATTAAAVPASAELGIDGLAPVITPNELFYRIDTALRVPQVDPADWSLRIHGLVDEPFELSWDELLALPLEESYTTLMCVSNEVGGGLIGNAKWLGYPIRELLARAKPQAGADMVLSKSIDGWTASSPLGVLQDAERNSVLAIGMNDEPLPVEHGFPARLVVPGLYGYVSATKWVTELEVTRFADQTAYWTDRGWSAEGPVKISSRIDVPYSGRTVDAGAVTIAGVAWDQHTGIAAVDVQIDGGAWQPAELATAISVDTWVQWRLDWTATSGDHRIRVRATSVDGEVQTEDIQGVIPDGATGLHEIVVRVA